MNTVGNTASKARALLLIHNYSFTQVLLSLALLMHTTAIYHIVTQTSMYNPASCLNMPSLRTAPVPVLPLLVHRSPLLHAHCPYPCTLYPPCPWCHCCPHCSLQLTRRPGRGSQVMVEGRSVCLMWSLFFSFKPAGICVVQYFSFYYYYYFLFHKSPWNLKKLVEMEGQKGK